MTVIKLNGLNLAAQVASVAASVARATQEAAAAAMHSLQAKAYRDAAKDISNIAVPDDVVKVLVDDEETLTGAALRALFETRTAANIHDYAAAGTIVGAGVASVDTAAFQAALDANNGFVVLPTNPLGNPYEINAPLTVDAGTSVVIIGTSRSTRTPIRYTGTGHMINVVSADPSDVTQSITDVLFENLSIDGDLNTTSDGAFNIDGAYRVLFNRVDVRRFNKAGAVATRIHNAFNVVLKHTSVLSIAAGVGVEVGGTDEQVTNVVLDDVLLQRSLVNLDITTGISGGGFTMRDSAIRANGSAIAVRCTGKFTNMSFGPGLHVESETTPAGNTTIGFQFSGAALFTSAVRFDGIDFYNIKTLFDLDGSAGIMRDVTIDNIYATGLAGLGGTAFKLNALQHVTIGRYNVNSSQYTTFFNLTSTDPVRPLQRYASTGLPAASDRKGQLVPLTDMTSRDEVRFSDGTNWLRLVMATSDGRIRAGGDIVWSSGQLIGVTSTVPEGNLTAPQGSLALQTDGTVWRKSGTGTNSTGWELLGRPQSRTSAQLAAIGDTINTIGKRAGTQAWNTTLNRPVWATGSTAGSTWVYADGTTAHTPV